VRPADDDGPGPVPVPAQEAPDRYPWHAPTPPPAAEHPERPSIQGHRAGLVTRVLANALDVGVVVLLMVGGYAVVAVVRFVVDPASFSFPAPSLALVLLIGAWVQFLYFTLAWATAGRTYGDEVLGLRVVNFRGEKMRWSGAALRAAACVALPIGLFWVVVSPQNRSIQDVLLRTSVVYDWTTRR
jgi:uncharacterized RDD family membrane protein YckC